MLGTFRHLTIAATVLFSTGAANAQFSASDANQMRRCVEVMLHGPALEDVRFMGEGFDCKPAKLRITPDSIELGGRISHRIERGFDHEVDYVIQIDRDGKLTNVGLSMPAKVSFETKHVAEGWDAGDMDYLVYIAKASAVKKSSTWESKTIAIVSALGVKVAQGVKQHNVASAKIGPAWFVDHPGRDYGTVWLREGQSFGRLATNSKAPATWVDACKSVCEMDTKCKAWTLERKSNACYLKDSNSGVSLNANTVSGVR
jgi:hypothetical protein